MMNSPVLQVTKQEAAIELLRRRKARRNLLDFILYTKPDYQVNWHHQYLCEKLDLFAAGLIKRLMVFMPPQHGKSEIVSRKFPAFILGKNPTLKIVGCSYSADLASSFNRDVQRVIDDEAYGKLFPDTYLNESNNRNNSQGGYLRNADIFETVQHRGFYKSVGVGGSLTGTPADIVIVDDPIKDAMEAYSIRSRNNVWDWYTNVLETRLHNNSQVLITMTRWHESDLAGKLLEIEGDKWEVVMFPALKETSENPSDQRNIGQALWEERHSREKLLSAKLKSERTFTALYQQRPAPLEGGILKSAWFKTISFEEFVKTVGNSKIDGFADTAYTEKQSNDPTALMSTCYHNGYLYIIDSEQVWLELPELLKHIPSFALRNRMDNRSALRIEPKASGKSIVQSFKGSSLNVVELPSPTDDKITRTSAIAPFIESGKCILVKGAWNEPFITECVTFPNGLHDDQVDNLTSAITYYTVNPIQRATRAYKY